MAELPKEARYSSFVFWDIPPDEAKGRRHQEPFGNFSFFKELEATAQKGYGNTTFLYQLTTIILAISTVVLSVILGYVCHRGRRGRDPDVNPTNKMPDLEENHIYCEPEVQTFGPTAPDVGDDLYLEPKVPTFGPTAVDAGNDLYLEPIVPTFGPTAVDVENRHNTERIYENCLVRK
ncbi:uncharacterized protein LOC143039428 [Oratosquilla oratoria]|uniref:uncharacterized protein LOC143039428 n=1 Tax=Oratosquilla oratoria TaxID=337810 RepID=UPI003F75C146